MKMYNTLGEPCSVTPVQVPALLAAGWTHEAPESDAAPKPQGQAPKPQGQAPKPQGQGPK